ncbi:MAG: copper resistance protein CopC [Bradyrhizobium sp.]|nr:copper resistance protein CopC [Bradyrhizobium sp.]MBA3727457.1 copper resistance protein CopC [Armatimonadota bacterium]
MSQTKVIGVVAALALGLMATSAVAHPKLKSTVPAADVDANASPKESTVATKDKASGAPKEIRLMFSEGVIAKMSGIVLKDKAGKQVPTGSPQADPLDQKQLVVPVATPLAPGRYNVTWRAVSDDTHRVKGEYNFTVGR